MIYKAAILFMLVWRVGGTWQVFDKKTKYWVSVFLDYCPCFFGRWSSCNLGYWRTLNPVYLFVNILLLLCTYFFHCFGWFGGINILKRIFPTTPYFSRKNPATVNKGNIPTAVVLIRWRKYNRQQSQDKFPSLTNKDELNYRTSFEFSFKMDRNKIILAKPILVHLSTVPHGYVHRSTSGGVQAPARLASDHQCVSVRRFSSNSFSNFAF